MKCDTFKEKSVRRLGNADGRTAPGVCGNGSVPLSHSGNVVIIIGLLIRSAKPPGEHRYANQRMKISLLVTK